MQRVLTDLWQTRTDSPFPGLTTHAFLWTGCNALFYSTATDADFPGLDDLGGVADQYLSHRDEAGPMLAKIADHFDSALHAPVTELLEIGQHAHVDVPVGSRHVDVKGMEVIPTPGHSPGGVCLQVGRAGDPTHGNLLIVGDTLFAGSIGRTDLPGGDLDVLLESIRGVLFPFGDDAIVWPGHGPKTTIGQERRTNPFLVER